MKAAASRRGFVMMEALATAAVLLAAGALLAVLARDTRRQARGGECIANLKAMSVAGAAFGTDNADRVWTFNWRRTDASNPSNPTTYADLQTAPDDLAAAANQAVHILRTSAGREDIAPISSWVASISYSHLMLAPYLGSRLPDAMVTCPEDKLRRQWAADPLGYDTCRYIPNPACGDNPSKRWPYSSSYQLPTYYFSPDAAVGGAQTIASGGSHSTYIVPGGVPLGRRRMTEVVYPAQKVLLHDAEARHYGPRLAFYAYRETRQPLLFADGGVSVRPTQTANQGGQPNNPASPTPTVMTYSPGAWEAPALNGSSVIGYYHWTRGGMRGRDFGSAEVPY